MNKTRMQPPSPQGARRADLESPTMIVEVKRQLPSVRSLRDALAQLAGTLALTPGRRALLWLEDPRMTATRIEEEFRRLGLALRPEISERLSFVVSRDGRIDDRPPELSSEEWRFLEELGRQAKSTADSLPRADLRSEVLRVFLLHWARGAGPVTLKQVQETVGCSYRTAASALKRLGKAVERHSDRRLELKYFPKVEWARLVATSDSARATRRYATPSGPPRSPESLARRLATLDRRDLAIGGAIGARHHDPELDLIGAPRLDVTVHAPDSGVDLGFVRRLDPGLEETGDPDAAPQLVLHFLRRREACFEKASAGLQVADAIECMLDLHEARLEQQAFELLNHLTAGRRES